jgi:uncharacterized protein YceK
MIFKVLTVYLAVVKRNVIFLIICMLLSSCGTQAAFLNASYPEHCNSRIDEIPRIYGGIAFDINHISNDHNNGDEAVFFDIPFSFVADTVTLPYTIYGQIRYGNICNQFSKNDK